MRSLLFSKAVSQPVLKMLVPNSVKIFPAPRRCCVDLQNLRHAVAAADYGSFRQAAVVLSIRQSTLSRSIRDLEQSIGIMLFERSSGGVAPTAAGRSVLRMARSILEEFDALLAIARSSQTGSAGSLALGFCSSLSAGNLRNTMSAFKRRFPKIGISTAERSRSQLTRMLRNGSLDILILTATSALEDCKSLPTWSERILVTLPSDHRLVERDTLHWTDLSSETVLISQYDPGQEIEDLLNSKLVSPVDRPKIERHDVSRGAIKALVSLGFGISLVLESDLGAALPNPLYRELRDGTGSSRLDFFAFWRAENENPALECFLELLREHYPSPAGATLRR